MNSEFLSNSSFFTDVENHNTTSDMQGLFGASLSEIVSYPGPLMAGELQQRAWVKKAERALSEQAVNYHTNLM
jgi:hypothetical protein